MRTGLNTVHPANLGYGVAFIPPSGSHRSLPIPTHTSRPMPKERDINRRVPFRTPLRDLALLQRAVHSLEKLDALVHMHIDRLPTNRSPTRSHNATSISKVPQGNNIHSRAATVSSILAGRTSSTSSNFSAPARVSNSTHGLSASDLVCPRHGSNNVSRGGVEPERPHPKSLNGRALTETHIQPSNSGAVRHNPTHSAQHAALALSNSITSCQSHTSSMPSVCPRTSSFQTSISSTSNNVDLSLRDGRKSTNMGEQSEFKDCQELDGELAQFHSDLADETPTERRAAEKHNLCTENSQISSTCICIPRKKDATTDTRDDEPSPFCAFDQVPLHVQCTVNMYVYLYMYCKFYKT